MNKRKKSKKNDLLEWLAWVPELIILPIRLIIWLARGLGKVVKNMFDGF